MNWQHKISDLSTDILKKRHTPAILKELAWKLLRFAVYCGRSNPFSFALRPLVSHHYLRGVVGVIIALTVMGACIWNPIPSFAGENTGGSFTVNVLPEGEITITTNQAIRIPTNYRYISQGFRFYHPGIDMAGALGTPIYPVMSGKVIKVLSLKWDYGNHVIIAHSDGLETLYAHLSKIEVTEGQDVNTGTEIGLMGSTGRSTGPHLHLEIRENGRPVNPTNFLDIK
jgi:hypothetical protein